jgi:LysM repeat protein
MAFRGQFVKLLMGGLPARLRRCRLGAPQRGWRKKEMARLRSKNSKQEIDILGFVKSAGAKIFGATETALPEQGEEEAGKHGLDVAQVKVKSADKGVLSGSAASTEVAEKIALAIGNSVGVATVQNDLAAAAEAPGSTFYAVQPGATLGKIAAAEHCPGRDREYHRIFAANKPLLSDPDKIYPGQVLRIPPLSD